MRFAKARMVRFLLCVVLGLSSAAPLVAGAGTAYAFGGAGSGTSGDPYQITTCAELDSINAELTADYVVENDIDCSGAAALNGGTGWIPIGQGTSGFQGTLDGQHHKITNLDLSGFPNTLQQAGMFDSLAGSALIKDLQIIGGKVNGARNTAMLVGQMSNTSTLNDVYVSATVTCHQDNCAGLVGALHDASAIVNSGVDVTITSTDISVGGLVGWISDNGSIQQSFANGTLSGTHYVGGLVGAVNNGAATATITDAYANVTVTSTDTSGGLVGLGGTVNVSNAYAVGSVSGGDSVAGLVGLSTGIIDESFAADTVTGTGTNDGPVTGQNFGSVTNSYFDTHKTGFSSSSDGSTAVNDSSTFIGNNTHAPMSTWDFSTIWRTNYNDYPSFAPLIDPFMLCEAPQSTNTTITGHCVVQPLGWGTPTWQAMWSVHGKNTWYSISLHDTHQALATVTGLTPGTTYDLEFRYTDDFGTGPWGKLVIATTGTAPKPSATTDTSQPTAYFASYTAPATGRPNTSTDQPTTTPTPMPQSETPVDNSLKHANSKNTSAYFWLGGIVFILALIAAAYFARLASAKSKTHHKAEE